MPALDWTELLRRAGITEPPGRVELVATFSTNGQLSTGMALPLSSGHFVPRGCQTSQRQQLVSGIISKLEQALPCADS
jgi:hypothetical protein